MGCSGHAGLSRPPDHFRAEPPGRDHPAHGKPLEPDRGVPQSHSVRDRFRPRTKGRLIRKKRPLPGRGHRPEREDENPPPHGLSAKKKGQQLRQAEGKNQHKEIPPTQMPEGQSRQQTGQDAEEKARRFPLSEPGGQQANGCHEPQPAGPTGKHLPRPMPKFSDILRPIPKVRIECRHTPSVHQIPQKEDPAKYPQRHSGQADLPTSKSQH